MSAKTSDWFVKPLIVTIVGGLLVGVPVAIFQTRLSPAPAQFSDADAGGEAAPGKAGASAVAAQASTVPSLPAVEKFSYALGVMWGPFAMGLPLEAIEEKTGPMQCKVEEYNGYYCSCQGVYDGVAVSFELGDGAAQNDPNACMRRDLPLLSMIVHFTPAERAAPRDAITSVLRAQLPQFRYLTSPERPAQLESQDSRPLYTFADGTYRLFLDYEAGSMYVSYYDSE